jgi:hypothetical protein
MITRGYYGDNSGAAKWIVMFATGLLIALGVLIVLATRTFSPQEVAIAKGIDTQNAISQQKAEIDLKYYGPSKEAEYQADLNDLAEKQRLQQELDNQKIGQDARDYDLTVELKRLLGTGAVATMVILAMGAAIYIGSCAWVVVLRALTTRQRDLQSTSNASRLGALYQVLTENSSTLANLQADSAEIRDQSHLAAVALRATADEFSQLRQSLAQILELMQAQTSTEVQASKDGRTDVSTSRGDGRIIVFKGVG